VKKIRKQEKTLLKKLFFILGITLFLLFTVSSVSAANWTVNPGDSIQSVVNGAAANDNITVNDDNGNPYNYTENVVVNKNLTLKANGTVGVNAQNQNNPVFRIDNSGSGSTIQGFSLKGVTATNQAVIYLNNANYCTITGNTIIGDYYPGAPTNTVNWGGILLYSSDYNLIYNNTVNNNLYSIRLDYYSNYNQIYNNNINNGYHGIRITGSSSNNAIYSNNIMGNNQYGISQTNTANNGNTVHFNRIVGNVLRGIFNEGPSIDATNNWWGSSGPSTTGTVTSSSYLVLIIQANPTTIGVGSTSIITADLTRNSNNEDTSTLGHIIDGTMVRITTDLGTVGSNSIEKPTTNGKATATLTADEGTGTAHVSAQLDGYTTTTTADVTIKPLTVYVNDVTGNDAYDGEAAVFDGIHGPKKTIQAGINTVADSGTVYIAAGTYKGSGNINLDIYKSINIQGSSKENTIIDAEKHSNIFDIYPGSTITIKDLTIKNGSEYWGGAIGNAANLTIINCNFENNDAEIGGAIFNVGNLTIENCNFSNNNAQEEGGAIYNGYLEMFPGQLGSSTVSNCVFTGNKVNSGSGGAIFNEEGTLNVAGSIFTNNTAPNNAGGIDNSGTVTITGSKFNQNTAFSAGAIFNRIESTLTVKYSNFISNIAIYEGGAILNMGTATFIGNNFINNTANLWAGAISNYGTLTANFNRIINNTAPQAFDIHADAQRGTVDARYNWWGSNNGPGPSSLVNVNQYTPWLVMRYSADPTTIQQGKTSTLTADFRYDSNGIFHDPANGHLPDGTPVTFTTNLGNVGSKSIVIGTLNGIATAILRGDEGTGNALTSAMLDGQTLTATVAITPVVNAASETSEEGTVGMQKTGLPLPLMVLAVLMVLGGVLSPKRK